MAKWTFEGCSNPYDGGVLKRDGRGIVDLRPAAPGHCIDTGELIATLLTQHETFIEAPADPVDDLFPESPELSEEEKAAVKAGREKIESVQAEQRAGLDVNLIARAFEVALPAHAGALSLSHNEHRMHFNTVAQYMAVERAKGAPVAFVSDGDEQEAQASNEMWILYWSSEKGSGRRVAGATLGAIFGWLQHHGLAFGN